MSDQREDYYNAHRDDRMFEVPQSRLEELTNDIKRLTAERDAAVQRAEAAESSLRVMSGISRRWLEMLGEHGHIAHSTSEGSGWDNAMRWVDERLTELAALQARAEAAEARVAEWITRADNYRDRCVELEARLDIGTGNMFDVVAAENERLRARVVELEAAQRWIPVSESKPDAGRLVLFRAYKSVYIGAYYPEADRWIGDDVSIAAATHWMPLPQPPEQESGE